jgi:hypothetical protein
MYGKVFTSMWGGSLYGRFEASAVLMVLLTLCDKDGIIDMTPEAIAGRTGWPLEFIKKGLAELEAPDPRSRSDDAEGRRIVLNDPARGWGWKIVNYLHYRYLADAEDKRKADRERIRAKRAMSQAVAEGRDVSQIVANVVQAKAEAEAEEPPISPKGEAREFRRLRQRYPKRQGAQRWPVAERFCLRLVASGVPWQTLLAAADRYRAYMAKTGKEGTEYVQQAATFYGSAGGWREPWDLPVPGAPQKAPPSEDEVAATRAAIAKAQRAELDRLSVNRRGRAQPSVPERSEG